MRFYSFSNIKILSIISHLKSLSKHFSSSASVAFEHADKMPKGRNKTLFSSSASEKLNLNEVNNLCSLALEIDHISWTKVSIPDVIVSDWDAFKLNFNLINAVEGEQKICSIINEVNEKIPYSDVYVMETIRWSRFLKRVYLRGQLVSLLLNRKSKSEFDRASIIFQNRLVMNSLFNLEVDRERRSTKPILDDIFKKKHGKQISSYGAKLIPEWFSEIKISGEMEKYFWDSKKETQESLSIAFLIAMAFINANFSTIKKKMNVNLGT